MSVRPTYRSAAPSRTILGIAAVFVGVSLAGTFATLRMVRAGGWLPDVPEVIGYFEGTVVPPNAAVLAQLGNPRSTGRTYRHPLGDMVELSVVTAGMFENYHDPTICVGGGDYRMTGVGTVALGDGEAAPRARAMVFRHRRDSNLRILMYYWQQNRDGTTDTEARMGNLRDIAARLRTGYGAVFLGHQTVLVRVFTVYRAERDPSAEHAQRVVDEISRAVQRKLLTEGSK
ncbi:MAG: exosortase-associated EpsI family protein [Armatimonadota bacterium]